jgi:hypothetical protein
MSTPPSISIPPAVQKPFTAATIGLYSFVLRRTAFVPSSNDRHPRLVVGRKALPRLAQQLEVLHVARVAGVRTIDRDEHDVVDVVLVVDRHGSDVSSEPDAGVSHF